MSNTIKKEKFYNHPIAEVWQAISNQQAISAWFIQADFKAEEGYQYKFTHESTTITGEVLEANPVYELVYTWIVSGTSVKTTVKWHLQEKEKGTLLRLEHSGIEDYKETAAQFFDNFSKGWDHCMDELEKYLQESNFAKAENDK